VEYRTLHCCCGLFGEDHSPYFVLLQLRFHRGFN
jgi:hypothetical protein